MSKSDASIKINPHKSADLVFDVVINGTDDNKPEVRFVIEDDCCDRLYKCVKSEGKHSWCAKLPALPELKNESYMFRVEVVVDGYFFAPARGKISMVQDPKVKFQAEAVKPSVTTSFIVKQEDDKPAEEASGGPEVTGQYAPTNGLLKPEYESPRSHMKAPGTEKDDERYVELELSDLGEPVPGPSTDHQSDGSNTLTPEKDFDPREVAAQIVKSRVGAAKRPDRKGSLFARDNEGKPVVVGLETPDQKRAREEKEATIKNILRSI